jgi:hypothetical protein
LALGLQQNWIPLGLEANFYNEFSVTLPKIAPQNIEINTYFDARE